MQDCTADLPETWTVIARKVPSPGGAFWRFVRDGFDKDTVDALRDAGRLLTAQRRAVNGTMELLAKRPARR